MREARIGRILAASLHQAIADELPTRLEYYEHWLHPVKLREGSVGIAAFRAVLSFLRREPEGYQAVVGRAGCYAADWFIDGLSPLRRRTVRCLPSGLRARAVVRLGRRLVRWTDGGARASTSVRGGRAHFSLEASAFCDVRESVERPLCGFYASALATLMERFDFEIVVQVDACRASGGTACRLFVDYRSP